MADRWVVSLGFVAANGNVTQCYPPYAAAGTAPASATPSNQVRQPCEGQLITASVSPDGTNAGVIEIYDISGHELGIDVSSATTITDTQLDAAITAGTARLVLEKPFVGNGSTPWEPIGPFTITKGIAARFVGAAGACKLNMVVQGCYRFLNGTT